MSDNHVFVDPSSSSPKSPLDSATAQEGIVDNPGVRTTPVGIVGNGPTCPWCHKSSLKVRHNRASGEGRIYCSECSYEDGSGQVAPAQGVQGVQVRSKHGDGSRGDLATGVKIVRGNGSTY
jgi:hypothetical protein